MNRQFLPKVIALVTGVALALVLGCGQDKVAERPSGITGETWRSLAAAPGPAVLDSTRTYSSTRVDSVVIWRTIRDTVRDTVWLPAPVDTLPTPVPLPAVTGRLVVGPFHVPPDSIGRIYSGGTMNANASTLAADLNKIRSKGGRIALLMGRSSLKNASGLNTARAKAELASWDSVAVARAIADGTVLLIYIADDWSAPEWGSYSMPTRAAMWDSIGGYARARWPNAAVAIRAKPSELAQYRPKWDHVTTAWAQYKGPYRDGNPKTYAAAQVAAAKALKMGLVLWLNVLDGGCGSPTPACLPEAPGTNILGTYVNSAIVRRYQMSAAELLYYGKTFLQYTCAGIQWRYSPTWGETAGRTPGQVAGVRAFDTRPDVRAAMASLDSIARTLPPTTCRMR